MVNLFSLCLPSTPPELAVSPAQALEPLGWLVVVGKVETFGNKNNNIDVGGGYFFCCFLYIWGIPPWKRWI